MAPSLVDGVGSCTFVLSDIRCYIGAYGQPCLPMRASHSFDCYSRTSPLAGKKHLHTAVVQLAPADPRLLAAVIREALQCGAQLTATEQV